MNADETIVAIISLMIGIVLTAIAIVPHTEAVDAGVGRTFECRKVDAVKVDGDFIKGEACTAVDK